MSLFTRRGWARRLFFNAGSLGMEFGEWKCDVKDLVRCTFYFGRERAQHSSCDSVGEVVKSKGAEALGKSLKVILL